MYIQKFSIDYQGIEEGSWGIQLRGNHEEVPRRRSVFSLFFSCLEAMCKIMQTGKRS